jgi:hypothetical protein
MPWMTRRATYAIPYCAVSTNREVPAGLVNSKTMSADNEMVGRCRLTVSKAELKARLVQHLKLGYDKLLSHFASNFKLRRYTMVRKQLSDAQGEVRTKTRKIETMSDDVSKLRIKVEESRQAAGAYTRSR